MATNGILLFCETDTGTNLLTQGEYNSDAQRLIGNQGGEARSALFNKTLKQTSAIASGMAQFMSTYQSGDITDTMTPAEIASAFAAALGAAGGEFIGKPGFCVTEVLPYGYLKRNGDLISMTDYELLFDHMGDRYGKDAGTTCTFDATANTVGASGHGLVDGDVVTFTTSSGLAAPLAISTKYFVVSSAVNTFKVSSSRGGTAIDLTTTGSGTNKFHSAFKLMDDRGLSFTGWNDSNSGTYADTDAATRLDRGDGTTGDFVGTLQASQNKAHTHSGVLVTASSTRPDGAGLAETVSAGSSGSSGGDRARSDNRQYMPIIKAYY